MCESYWLIPEAWLKRIHHDTTILDELKKIFDTPQPMTESEGFWPL